MTTEWPKKMDPEEYLRRYPDGEHAELAAAVLADREESGFRTSTWHNMVLYHCPACPFTSVDLDAMKAHVAGRQHTGARWSTVEEPAEEETVEEEE